MEFYLVKIIPTNLDLELHRAVLPDQVEKALVVNLIEENSPYYRWVTRERPGIQARLFLTHLGLLREFVYGSNRPYALIVENNLAYSTRAQVIIQDLPELMTQERIDIAVLEGSGLEPNDTCYPLAAGPATLYQIEKKPKSLGAYMISRSWAQHCVDLLDTSFFSYLPGFDFHPRSFLLRAQAVHVSPAPIYVNTHLEASL